MAQQQSKHTALLEHATRRAPLAPRMPRGARLGALAHACHEEMESRGLGPVVGEEQASLPETPNPEGQARGRIPPGVTSP